MDIAKTIMAAIGSFAIGFAVVYLIAAAISRIRRKLRKRKQAAKKQEAEVEAVKPKRVIKIGTMDIILIIMAVGLLLFTLKMIDLFETYSATPDTLITCVFGLCGGECGALGWIKTTKEKYRERNWRLEEQRKHEEAAKTDATYDTPRNEL